MHILLGVMPVLLMAGLIFGGLFGGLFTPTEAGAVGAAICVLIALGSRSFSWQAVKQSVIETVVTTSGIFVIAIGANLLGRFVTISGVDGYLSDMIISIASNQFILLGGIVLVYLILGMFLDPVGAMLVTLPILLPVVRSAEIDLLWFGVFVAKLLEIGMITPPIGLNVFVIKSVTDDSIRLEMIFRGVIWFLLADLLVVLLLIVYPGIITNLPGLF